MIIKSSSDVRKQFAECLDSVVEDGVPLVITRSAGRKPAVMISLEEYNSLIETCHLLSTQENRDRLLSSINKLPQQD
jgi:antitoxin YefM